MTIYIQGMCYSGKSTIGKMLADYLKIDFLDSRDIFYNMHNVYDLDYLQKHGKEMFADAERSSFLQEFGDRVIALSGSALYHHDIMQKLKENHNIIWLKPPLNVILQRKAKEDNAGYIRPIVFPDNINTFEDLFQSRNIIYEKYYTNVVNINEGDTTVDVLNKIISII